MAAVMSSMHQYLVKVFLFPVSVQDIFVIHSDIFNVAF